MLSTKNLLVSKTVGFLGAITLCCGSLAQAALPPQHQNSNDLNAMLSYVNANPVVMSSLQAIDLVSRTVFYGEGCTAVFERLVIEKPAGWVGPADPLVIKDDSCPSFDDMADLPVMTEGDEIGDTDSITSRETDACSVDVQEASCTP